MAEERPITRADAEALLAQVNDAIASGRERATVEFAGSTLEFVRSTSGVFTLRAPGQPGAMRVFQASAAREPDYPTDMPFAADETAMLSGAGRTTSLIWWAPRDPDRLFAFVEAELLRDGWTAHATAEAAAERAIRKTYVKGDVQHFLMLSSGTVSLVRRPSRTA